MSTGTYGMAAVLSACGFAGGLHAAPEQRVSENINGWLIDSASVSEGSGSRI